MAGALPGLQSLQARPSVRFEVKLVNIGFSANVHNEEIRTHRANLHFGMTFLEGVGVKKDSFLAVSAFKQHEQVSARVIFAFNMQKCSAIYDIVESAFAIRAFVGCKFYLILRETKVCAKKKEQEESVSHGLRILL